MSATSVTYGVKAYDTTVDPDTSAISAACTGGSGSGRFFSDRRLPAGRHLRGMHVRHSGMAPRQPVLYCHRRRHHGAVVQFRPVRHYAADDEPIRSGSELHHHRLRPTWARLSPSTALPRLAPTSRSGRRRSTVRRTTVRGNTGHASFNVTVTFNDTQAPTFTPNPPPPVGATTSGTGAVVNYTVAATDDSGTPPTVNCTPPSGSTFPVGQTTVNCTASDGTNTANASFIVTVTFVDTTAPVISNVPSNRVVEANGPSGSVVSYTGPTATDAAEGPKPVSCSPTSGSTFPLGGTTVNCTASDSHGNTSSASFTVTVVDTTKPNLIVPSERAVYADTPLGIGPQGYGVPPFLEGASATDTVDPHPVITTDAPEFFTVGVHTVTFTAVDASGNGVSKTAVLEVLPMPPAGTPPLPIPAPRVAPPDVSDLKAEAGDRRVRLSWQIPPGVDHVVISRSLSLGGDVQVVYTGSAESFLDRAVVNTLEYRYVVVSVDQGWPGLCGSCCHSTAEADAPEGPERRRSAPQGAEADLGRELGGELLQRAALPRREEDPERLAPEACPEPQEQMEVPGAHVQAVARRLPLVCLAGVRSPQGGRLRRDARLQQLPDRRLS